MKKDIESPDRRKTAQPLSPRLSLQPAQWKGRTRPAIKPPPRVSRWVSKITKPVTRKFGFAEPHILTHWDAIVGPGLAAYAQPVKLSFAAKQRRRGLLTVQVSGAAGLELQHLEPQILERINAYYGAPTVGRLRLVRAPSRARQQKPAPSPTTPAAPLSPSQRAALESQLTGMTHEGVESALRRLGENILSRNPRGASKSSRS